MARLATNLARAWGSASRMAAKFAWTFGGKCSARSRGWHSAHNALTRDNRARCVRRVLARSLSCLSGIGSRFDCGFHVQVNLAAPCTGTRTRRLLFVQRVPWTSSGGDGQLRVIGDTFISSRIRLRPRIVRRSSVDTAAVSFADCNGAAADSHGTPEFAPTRPNLEFDYINYSAIFTVTILRSKKPRPAIALASSRMRSSSAKVEKHLKLNLAAPRRERERKSGSCFASVYMCITFFCSCTTSRFLHRTHCLPRNLTQS